MTVWKKFSSSAVVSVLVALSVPITAFALQSSSATYGLDEAVFGSGGQLNACSGSYCTRQSLGENAVGNSASQNYQIQAGSNITDRQPFIELIVNGTNTNLGTLSENTTATTTGTFSVRTYLASSYSVINASDGPQNGNYIMKSPITPTASATRTEQFGINLVNNTVGGACNAPANFGANPAQIPDNTFAYGQVAANYATCGKYMYKKNDVVAYSNQSSSNTNYTISYIFNINPVTPGGTYTFKHVLVATSTY